VGRQRQGPVGHGLPVRQSDQEPHYGLLEHELESQGSQFGQAPHNFRDPRLKGLRHG